MTTDAPAPEVAAPEPPPSHPPLAGWVRGHLDLVALAALVVIVAAVMFAARTDGHWWGDDWALYVRQADSLVHGGTRGVIADNEFTERLSPGTEFTPALYPWGFPLILAPFVAVLGTDLDRLVVAEVACACWFLVMWYVLARRRVGRILALAGVGVLGLSGVHVRWSELIQSELPFMAVAATALVVLDRPRVRASLVDAGAALRPLVAIGVAAAAAFSVRREGLGMVAAIGAAQLAALAGWWWARVGGRGATDRPDATTALSGVRWDRLLGRLALPYVSMLAVIAGLQVVLPSTLVPSYSGTGLGNVIEFASDHLGNVAQSLGLRDVGVDTPTVLGNAVLGSLAVAAFLALLAVGVVMAARHRAAADLPLVAFLAAVYLIGGSFRHPGDRYLTMVGPVALIFAIAALRAVAVRLAGPGRGVALAAGLVLLLLIANAVRSSELVRSARDFQRADAVEWGPDAPASQQMFDAVRRLTDDDAVVGFFKARAMTLLTDRRSLQIGGTGRPVEAVAGVLTDVVLESGDAQVAVVESLPDRYQQVWTNGRFTLYHLTN